MSYIITIDTGTTNTRCTLLDSQYHEITTEKCSIGVRNTAIEGNNATLKTAIRDCLNALIAKMGIDYSNVSQVIASGMITSNVGLIEIPHVEAPAGKEELAQACVSALFEDVCPLPILFIPGIKNYNGTVTLENFESMDMMRGEEVETIAILDQYPKNQAYLLVLPGSHTKFVSVDKNGRITGCLTTIGGELLSAIIHDTIIADATGGRFVEKDSYDRELFLLGAQTAKKVGTARACFSGRILSQFVMQDKSKISSFVTGAVLQCDLNALKESATLLTTEPLTVIVSGKEPLCSMLMDLLKADGYFLNIITHSEKANMSLSARGACLVAAQKGIL